MTLLLLCFIELGIKKICSQIFIFLLQHPFKIGNQKNTNENLKAYMYIYNIAFSNSPIHKE